jgi:hypothetical protein
MVPRGLILALLIGLIAGPVFGIILYQTSSHEQLVFVDGSSISILTEKIDFDLGEEISIKIINSGTTELTFSDTSYGLEIKQLDGIVVFRPLSSQVISTLNSHDEIEFSWDQLKNNGEQILEGSYKIMSVGFDDNKNIIKKSIIINILK